MPAICKLPHKINGRFLSNQTVKALCASIALIPKSETMTQPSPSAAPAAARANPRGWLRRDSRRQTSKP